MFKRMATATDYGKIRLLVPPAKVWSGKISYFLSLSLRGCVFVSVSVSVCINPIKKKQRFDYFYFMCMVFCLSECLCTVCMQSPQRPEEGSGSPRTSVTDGYASPWVLRKRVSTFKPATSLAPPPNL